MPVCPAPLARDIIRNAGQDGNTRTRHRSVLRRMPAGSHPQPSCQNEARPIQSESCHSRSPNGCRSIDPSRAFNPCEMLAPTLLTGVEDAHPRPSGRIDDEHAVALVVIAERTGKPEVAFLRWSAEGPRDQMIDLHGLSDDKLLGQAVTTAMSRLLRHSTPQVARDMGGAHRMVRRLEMSCPRLLRSLAACARINIARSYS